ncbi:MAG: maleylpyruvate isomerase N-terminal domain-containing protein, partial [Nocardioidaceae bacterium]
TTRMMEIAVHSDDLAASVDVATPDLPAEVVDTVVDLLSRLAVRRHGPTAVLRALTRAERAPAGIAAF